MKNNKKKVVVFLLMLLLLLGVVFTIRSCTTNHKTNIVDEQTSSEDVLNNDLNNTIEAENKENEKEVSDKEYTITFINRDGSILLKTIIKEGSTPYYTGGVPKYSDGVYIYSFIGWDKAIKAAYKDETYIARYSIKGPVQKEETKKEESKKDEGSYDNPPPIIDNRPNAVVDVAPVGKIGLAYNGTEQELLDSLGQSSTGTLMYGVSTTTNAPSLYSTNNPKVTNAGTYYVFYFSKGDASHQNSIANYVIVKIDKISGSIDTNPTAIESLKCNGSSQVLINAGVSSTGTMQYGIGTDTVEPFSYSSDLPTRKNIGTYYVWYYSKGDVNHNDTAPSKISVSMGRGDGVISKVPVLSDALEYTGSALPLIVAGQSYTGTIKYSVTTTNSKPENKTGFDINIPTRTEKGTYYVWYFADESENFFATDIQGPLVAELTGTKCKVTKAPTAKTLTFKNTDQELINPGESSGTEAGKMMYAVMTTTDMPTDDKYSETGYKAKNAGTYYVWYKAVPNQGSPLSQSVPKSIEVKIAKAPGTAVAPTAKDLTYSGDDQVLITQSGSPTGTMKYMVSSSKPTSKADFKDLDNATGLNAGTYKVWYYAEESDNYLASDISTSSVDIEIKKASGSITAPTANSLTYNGASLALVSDGSSETGTVYYALGDDSKATGTYSTTKPSGINAGSYYVWYYSKGDANHNDTDPACVKVEINKADGLVKTAPVAKELEFNNNEQDLVTAGASDTGEMYYYMNTSTEGPQGTGKFETSIPHGVNVGKYYVWYISKGDSNHKDTAIAGPVEVEITKIKCKVTTPPTVKKNLVYKTEDQELIETFGTSEGDVSGVMVYAVTSTTDAPSDDKYADTNPKAKNAGTYYVWYKAVPQKGDTDHADSVPKSIEVKITKAPGAAASVAANDLTYSGSDQALVSQSGTPTGTMKYLISSDTPVSKEGFKDISEIKGKDAGAYRVWFFADESDNYLATELSAKSFINVVINQHDALFEAPTANDLTYTGEEQSLITQPGTPSGTVKYLMTSDKTKPENTDGFGSIDLLKATNAFTGYVWYYVEESVDGNYKGLDICDEPLEVKIKKAKCSIKTPAEPDTTIALGAVANLLSVAAESDDGDIKYALGTDSENAPTSGYSSDIPQSTETDETYYVWYKAFSRDTDNYEDSDAVCLQVNIASGLAFENTSTSNANIYIDYQMSYKTYKPKFQYKYTDSTDDWADYTIGTKLTVKPNQKILFRAKDSAYGGCDAVTPGSNVSSRLQFKSSSTTGVFKLSGNLLYLINKDLSKAETTSYCFMQFFSGLNAIYDAQDLKMPSKIADSACSQLFYECSNLVNGPKECPATEVGSSGYYKMFYNCSSLLHKPKKPDSVWWDSTTFDGCTSLLD